MKTTVALTALALTCAVALAVPELNLPPRDPSAPNGTEFYGEIASLPRVDRENAICDQISAGNIPPFMRTLKAVAVNRAGHAATMYVTPDYLAVGDDADYFHMPMSPILAQRLADISHSHMPTRRMVGDIYLAAQKKVAPQPIAPSAAMITVPVFWDHEQMLRTTFANAGVQVGQLVGGHKKDVAITPLLYSSQYPNRVAIYGWHQLNGSPIQPLYLGHEDTYADYSHGIRLVHREVIVDGQAKTLTEVLNDPTLAEIFSDEGPFTPPRYPVPVVPTFPLIDSFPSTGRELDSWTNRFVAHAVTAFSPTSPGGDGTVLLVRDPSGGIDSTRTADYKAKDYYVQAHIYCQMRTDVAANGFERVGIFIRDNGNGMFDGSNVAGTIKGNNYSLTFDSNDGRVRCLKTVDGVATDMLATPVTRPTTAWRLLRIEAEGTHLRFLVDGEEILAIDDATHAKGQCGIGYHEFFATNANIQGTRADNFMADGIGDEPVEAPDGDMWGCY